MSTHSDQPTPNPVWAVRGMPFVAMIAVALAMFVFKTSPGHGFCLGLALGLLIGYSLFAMQIKRVIVADTPQPSDVSRYPLT